MLKQSILTDFKKNLSILKIDNHSLKSGKNTVLSEKQMWNSVEKHSYFIGKDDFEINDRI